MKIEENFYGVILASEKREQGVFLAFGTHGAPELFDKRKTAVEFKKGLIKAGCKKPKVVKVAVTLEFETGGEND